MGVAHFAVYVQYLVSVVYYLSHNKLYTKDREVVVQTQMISHSLYSLYHSSKSSLCVYTPVLIYSLYTLESKFERAHK